MNAYETAAKLMAQVQRAGARHSAKDNAMVQEMHDRACELGAKCKCEEMTVHPTLRAAVEALVLRHPGHPNQKVHGNRFGGYGTTKESLRRLKGDKEARERYKASARKKAGGGSQTPDQKAESFASDLYKKVDATYQKLRVSPSVKTSELKPGDFVEDALGVPSAVIKTTKTGGVTVQTVSGEKKKLESWREHTKVPKEVAGEIVGHYQSGAWQHYMISTPEKFRDKAKSAYLRQNPK